MFVMGSMIGSGIFIVSADMMRNLGLDIGSSSFVDYYRIMTVAAALSYMANFRQCFQKAGGQYTYITEIFGKRLGFCTVGECLP